MALWNNKSVDEERLEYISFLKKMGSTMDLVIKYAEDTEHYDQLVLLGDEVKYFLPIQKESIMDIDKKINNVLGDLKLRLYTNRDPDRVTNLMEQLDRLCDERSTKI
jgi:hypothetical protein